MRKRDKKKIKLNKKIVGKFSINKRHNRGIGQKLQENLLVQINKLNYILSKKQVTEILELSGRPTRFLIRNFTSGIIKGIGIGIGFSIITAIIIYFVQKLIKLNIPGISQYIADIIEIVKQNR
ncbi:MAG: DUF5665 domain-containing protein [Clostridia bacterium]